MLVCYSHIYTNQTNQTNQTCIEVSSQYNSLSPLVRQDLQEVRHLGPPGRLEPLAGLEVGGQDAGGRGTLT